MARKKIKQRVHFLAPFMINPPHPIQIKLAGVGGNGTHILKGLVNIHLSLRQLDHPGLFVTAYDGDKVSLSNVGRQVFLPGDIGQNKAEVFINRIARTYGIQWNYKPEPLNEKGITGNCNIFISCVDKGITRVKFGDAIKTIGDSQGKTRPFTYDTLIYWLDMGNNQHSGQVILGSLKVAQPKDSAFECIDRLPNLTEMFPDIDKNDKVDQGPSCSTMEALNRQDLFINSMITGHALKLLWKLLKDKVITYHGIFYNGETETLAALEI